MTVEAFEALLDAYGSQEGRWPAAQRAAAEALIEASAEARALLREARALDALLAKAPPVAPGRLAALTERIVDGAAGRAAAGAPEPAPARAGGAMVVQLPGRPPRDASPSPFIHAAGRQRQAWPAAAALAASLVLGVLIGALSPGSVPVRGLVEIASVDDELSQLARALASDGLTTTLEEEQL